jgi:hypothetical protein
MILREKYVYRNRSAPPELANLTRNINMTRRRLIVAAFLSCGLALMQPVLAAVPKVDDKAGFFSKAAIDQELARIGALKSLYHVEVVIETFPEIPKDMRARYDSGDKQAFFRSWSGRRAAELEVKGIYVLICKAPTYFYIEPDESVRGKSFTVQDRDNLIRTVQPLVDAGKYDEALDAIVTDIKVHSMVANSDNSSPSSSVNASSPFGWIGWVCITIVAIVAGWIIVGRIRASKRRTSG